VCPMARASVWHRRKDWPVKNRISLAKVLDVTGRHPFADVQRFTIQADKEISVADLIVVGR